MRFTAPPLIAVATGIVGSAWASGVIMAFSIAAPAAAKTSPDAAATAKVWREFYARGANLMPKVVTVVFLSYAYAAYAVRDRGGRWAGFVAAACSALSIVPYTFTLMKKTNAALHQAAARTPDDSSRVYSLVDTWTGLNFARGLLPLAGTVLGIKSLLDNTL
ncbi:hypothetical protein L249_4579 [Ophiocordyceps polyrhachis-furcata BCC 54312]|uniref:DUF1772 domain-containing protein n=1 Tax=Ophiocordyceps polyrhachis-furcata BCC 54312 TaxID=1330021 RepID=A0A367LC24_9HYPO|nr:hypothetical protein L249_4579 [Ophiocordyceps polyrhachis-furcata BCC 54312]